MIQRIQSVYLFLTALLITLMLCLPLARFFGSAEAFTLTAFGVKSAQGEASYVVSTLYMGIVLVLAAVVPFVNIFLFKKRMVQIRLCIVEIILLIGAQIFVGYYLYRAAHSVAGFTYHAMKYTLPDVFPLIGIIFTYLALRGIARDETLVRSLDRIR